MRIFLCKLLLHFPSWYGMVSTIPEYGMVWYGMVWYGMVWYGMVWYGMVWYMVKLYLNTLASINMSCFS
jgi:chloride channel 2